jgi:two-component system nitrogen regulation sensor histidine kinase NtrY
VTDRLRFAARVGLAAGGLVAAEWLRAPSWILASGLGLLSAVTVAAAMRSEPRRLLLRGGAWALVALAAASLVQTGKVSGVVAEWPEQREEAITRASRLLGGELNGAVALARGLAERGAPAADRGVPGAFAALAAAMRKGAVLHGATLFDAEGAAVAWAGAQRLNVEASGAALEVVTTPYYLWLVARRQSGGASAVGTVLLARLGAVPRAGESLAERFAARTGVGLEFLDHRSAPDDSVVFDYVVPGSAPADTLFAVRLVPPAQAAVLEATVRGARQWIAALLIIPLIALAALAARERGVIPQFALPLGAALVALARIPFADVYGGALFDPDAYYAAILGPFSSSAGTLAAFGFLVSLAAGALWRLGTQPGHASRVIAFGGAVAAPYLVQNLARGIAPPASGTPMSLWLAWQGALTLVSAAIVLLAAALVRGRELPVRSGLAPFAAALAAIAGAGAGLWLWDPVEAWPAWYPYLWVPAFLLAIRPMPLRSALATIAMVAGSAAALLTWGAAAEGRMALAQRDLEGLGDRADPVAVTLLDQVARSYRPERVPMGAGGLYVWWRGTPPGAQGFPAELAVWGADGSRVYELSLADLEVPPDSVLLVVSHARETLSSQVRTVVRAPGLHGVAAMPLPGGAVVSVVIGPRSRLVAPTRLARLLASSGPEREPPYEIVLSPAGTGPASDAVHWEREGWLARGERSLVFPGGERHAHALVDLRGPAPLLQRGLLVLAFDVGLLLLLWLFLEVLSGRLLPAVRTALPRMRRSLRWRLTASLAVFFLAPTVAFAVWSYGRLEAEFRGARALLLQRTLRDAAAVLPDIGPDATAPLREAARRFDALLSLAHDGRIDITAAPVLLEFGLLDRLVDGAAYQRLAWGDHIEASADQPAAPVPTLVGYRLLARTGNSTVALSAPEFLSDPALRRREADLGIAVLVATLLGFLAAIVLSALAARAIAHPLQRLRGAALAIGAGEPAELEGPVPTELEPIALALRQAAADVERGQRAQRVLAWGEMARQVAHEIKNPLTPIRLGIQHLLRIQADRPAEVGPVLTTTGERILAEIDRLDSIARTFSRFALPGEGIPVEALDVAAVVHDVVRLYGMGDSPVAWEEDTVPGLRALARRDELMEVLVNLCENARDAGAHRVVVSCSSHDGGVAIEVRDDGRGIAPDVMPRVFEPRFSTTTSGSGLGLAIARRLVESWGGTIGIGSRLEGGTVVTIVLRTT